MKRVALMLMASMFVFACSVSQIKNSPSGDKPSIDITTKLEKYKGTDYLVITDKKTQKSWVIEYGQWQTLTKAYKYWETVTNNKPKILNIKEEEGYLVINFCYEYTDPEKKVNATSRILAGKVYVPKKYINDDVKRQLEVYRGVVIGTGTYSALTTVLLIILLIILL